MSLRQSSSLTELDGSWLSVAVGDKSACESDDGGARSRKFSIDLAVTVDAFPTSSDRHWYIRQRLSDAELYGGLTLSLNVTEAVLYLLH